MTDSEPVAAPTAPRAAVPLRWRLFSAVGAGGASVAGAVASAYLHLARPVTFREILMFAGAGLLGAGLYPIYAPAALIVPGLVLTYVAIAGVK